MKGTFKDAVRVLRDTEIGDGTPMKLAMEAIGWTWDEFWSEFQQYKKEANAKGITRIIL